MVREWFAGGSRQWFVGGSWVVRASAGFTGTANKDKATNSQKIKPQPAEITQAPQTRTQCEKSSENSPRHSKQGHSVRKPLCGHLGLGHKDTVSQKGVVTSPAGPSQPAASADSPKSWKIMQRFQDASNSSLCLCVCIWHGSRWDSDDSPVGVFLRFMDAVCREIGACSLAIHSFRALRNYWNLNFRHPGSPRQSSQLLMDVT